jgi:putative salt-induced outer membrane protein
MKKTILIAMSLSALNVAWAEEPASKWSGDVELGLVMTDGNTETQSLNTKLSLINERTKWRNEFKAEGLKVSDETTTTAEKYLASGKTNYKVTENNYIFALAKYEDDRFSGFDYQAGEFLGYGHRFTPADTVTVDAEIGAGARQSQLATSSSTKNEAVGRLAGAVVWKISETSEFKEELNTDIGKDNTISKSVTSLKAKVSTDLSMKLSLTVKHTSDVPVGTANTDTETAVTLVYNLL